ncbi:MAG: hypothetical protein ABIB47_04895 [Candidatus Woesearchaeota archaeon]
MKKDTRNKVLKNAGKVAVAVAVPPVGLALFGKTGEKRLFGGIMGLCLSLGVTLPGSPAIKLVTIGDSPNIASYSNLKESNWLRFLEGVSSPLTFYLDPTGVTSKTKVSEGDESLTAYNGRNCLPPISFSQETGKYVLTFGEDTVFDGTGRTLDGINQDIRNCQGELEGYVSNGNVIKKRVAETRLGELNGELESATARYEEVRTEFGSHVERLNSELESVVILGEN